ncbi:hypothetical protein [Mucilaginibacter sp.]|uniref:hypothetical protein n=1 Tax=Mucilaginibacter sp. TaxID=1882438 RepID=UPI00260F5CCB|nr:hypothetical protein [Mucilaginibacter sp.]
MKIVSGILILITVYFSLRHGWAILTIKPGETNMFTQWNISRAVQIIVGLLTLAVGLMVLFFPTFFAGNVINATLILLIMALHLKDGNLKAAVIEVPFLLLPLVMIWLGHPLKK